MAGFTRFLDAISLSNGCEINYSGLASDVGVANTLARRGIIEAGSELFGSAFEHFIVNELRAWLAYTRRNEPLSYWRSTAGHEVDVIVGDFLALKVKATSQVAPKHLKGLRALKEEVLIAQYAVVSTDPEKRVTHDGITVWPWREFLTELWGDWLVLKSTLPE